MSAGLRIAASSALVACIFASTGCIDTTYYSTDLLVDVTFGATSGCYAAGVDQLSISSPGGEFSSQTVACASQVILSPVQAGTYQIQIEAFRGGTPVYSGVAQVNVPRQGAELAISLEPVGSSDAGTPSTDQ